jgi:periplasmic protein TonB
MGDVDLREFTAQPRFLLVLLVQAVVAFACLAAIVGLRFFRRGAARFWIGPAVVALCVLPGVVAAGLVALAFRGVIGGTALAGSGGASALAAGAMEALSPLLVGLATVVGLSFCAFVAVLAGTSRVDEAAPSGGATWGPLLAPLVIAFGFGPVLGATALANHGGFGALETERMVRWWWLVSSGTVAALVALVAFALATLLRAPRGRAPLVAKLLPPLSLAVVALLAFGSWVFALSSMGRLSARALSEQPVVAAAEEPEAEEPSPEPSVEPDAETTEPAPSEPEATAPVQPTPRPTARPRPVATHAAPAPEAPRTVRVGGSILEPRKLKNVSPVYPATAKQARVQGIVILECTIGADGRVKDVKVLRSVELLDAAAVDAVRQWVYTPTLLNGVPVSVIMTVTVNFKLS